MTKRELYGLIVECKQEYLSEIPNTMPKPVKENTMRKSELKALVNEVVRQCVAEAGPQYKVRNGKFAGTQTGKKMHARELPEDPLVNELADMVDEPSEPEVPDIGGEEPGQYNEQDEIRLLKAMAKAILALLKMHKGMEEPEGEEADDGVPFKKPEGGEGEETETPSEPENDEEEGELKESNHKVQERSFKTVKDVPQDPENVRDPKVPQ